MELTEFLNRLHDTPRRWKLIEGMIRFDGWLCPLARTFSSAFAYEKLAKEMGLDTLSIMTASDFVPRLLDEENQRLRRMLLWATGIDNAPL